TPGVLGIAFGARTRSLRAAEARAMQLELERREAIAEERSRIARELHDVITHSVSVMTVQAGAAEAMLSVDPAKALAPQPSLRDVERLAQQVRDAGLPVEVRIEGQPRPLPIGVDLSAYRVVQEALTNALKHAGTARATVRVSYGERDVTIEVTDDGAGGEPN